MNKRTTLIFPFLLLVLTFFSCRDTASTGFICNFTGNSARFVMSPIDTLVFSQQIERGSVTVLDYNVSSQSALLEVADDECLWIANGINGLNSSDLFIDYLELRLPTETRIYRSKQEIFSLFEEVQNEVYEIRVRE